MTQRTGNEVQKITEKIRPEEDHHFIMEMEIFAQ